MFDRWEFRVMELEAIYAASDTHSEHFVRSASAIGNTTKLLCAPCTMASAVCFALLFNERSP